ncbi:MAG: S-layer family protein [Scytonematopsis contorta HA4267-MV1]|jgi:filamentous hemagglutinin family protein|nr:S-layer family protein [Scytonematopsis contorta HA4267-MV1]
MSYIFHNGFWNLNVNILMLCISTVLISIKPCFGQSNLVPSNIVPDNTLGAESSKIVTEFNNRNIELIEGGAERGQNLFHSLEKFNVSEQRGVYFLAPGNRIKNIFTRVTGKNSSEILGILGTMSDRNFTPSSANIFLINPSGIIFGKNARLDVGGSFVGTTANSIEFGERGVFSATNPQIPSSLLTVSPGAFLFNQINAQAVIQSNSVNNLQVSNGKSLFLIGGNVSINGEEESRGISAPGGRVELGGLASSGKVKINVEDSQGLPKLASLIFPDNVERADVLLSKQAVVNVANSGAGDIAVNARNVNIIGGSRLIAGIAPSSGSQESQAGDVKINATGTVVIDGVSNGFISGILNQVERKSIGNSGKIEINADSVEVKNGAQLNGGTLGTGNSGIVRINANNKVVFDGTFSELRSAAFSQVGKDAVGNSSGIEINARTLEVTNGGYLEANTLGSGNAGKIKITATDKVVFDGESSLGFISSAFSQVEQKATGNSGGIEINARNLEVTNGAQLSASTLGSGNAGKIKITAADRVVFNGQSPSKFLSSALSQVKENAVGNSEGIEIKANNVEVTSGAFLDASTLGNGSSGLISITDTNRVVFDGESQSGFLSAARSQAVGKAKVSSGGIQIDAGDVSVTNGASFDASTLGAGDAGKIQIRANGMVLFDGKSSNGIPSYAVAIGSEGKAGGIDINAGTLKVNNQAFINVNTLGNSQAGNITITANNMDLINDSKITARSQGAGIAGNVEISVKNNFNANNGQVTTESKQSDGGNISITTGKNIILRNNSDIIAILSSTSGRGGNIRLNANSAIVALEDSDIFAFAPEGKGGNIRFETRAFLSDPLLFYRPTPSKTDRDVFEPPNLEKLDGNNRVDVNASGGINPGTITSIQDISFLQSSLAELPENLINTNSLIASSCVARSNDKNGTFFITGTGGLPYRPGDTVPSNYTAVEIQSLPANTSSNIPRHKPLENKPRPWKIGDPIIEPSGVYRLNNGQQILGRECTW